VNPDWIAPGVVMLAGMCSLPVLLYSLKFKPFAFSFSAVTVFIVVSVSGLVLMAQKGPVFQLYAVGVLLMVVVGTALGWQEKRKQKRSP
jgi:hypothetical protein